MDHSKCYDLFVVHAWRFHDDWSQFVKLLDQVPGIEWRNFSVPWHDPAMKPSTEVGRKFIYSFLESQIIPAQAVILLAGVYAINSARKWIDLEIEFARKHGKLIIGVPQADGSTVPKELTTWCDDCVGWNATEVIRTIDESLISR
jgi:hypothetical protein